MDQNQKDSDSQVTIEELLQLKKYEQPDEKFWNRFDKDLQRKTLKTLIKPPSFKERIFGILSQIPMPNRGIIAITPALALLAISFSPVSTLMTSENTVVPQEYADNNVSDVNTNTVSTPDTEIDLSQLAQKSDADFVIEAISVKEDISNNDYYTDFSDGSVMLLTQDSTIYMSDDVSLTGNSATSSIYSTNSLF